MFKDCDEKKTSAQIAATCNGRTMIARMNNSGRLEAMRIISVNAQTCPLPNPATIDRIEVMSDQVQPSATLRLRLPARGFRSLRQCQPAEARIESLAVGAQAPNGGDCSSAGMGGTAKRRMNHGGTKRVVKRQEN